MQKRRDVLRTYGSYPQPLLLLKALPEESVQIPYGDKLFPSEIRHAGGKPIAANSDAFFELKRWLDNGANRDGLASAEQARAGHRRLQQRPAAAEPRARRSTRRRASYQTFVDVIQPFLQQSCAYGTCHSSPQADFYLTCGGDDGADGVQLRPGGGLRRRRCRTAVEQSEILLRPLSPQGGGVSHTGGVFFKSRDDDTWKTHARLGRRRCSAAPPQRPAGQDRGRDVLRGAA